MSYQETLNTHKAELLRLKSERAPIDVDDVFTPLDWEQVAANKPFLAFLISDKIASRKDVEVARGRALAKRTLGVSPRTCCEYVGAYLNAHRVTASFGGTIRAADVRTGSIAELTLDELKEDMRVMAVELALPVQRDSINDACNQWFREARQARIEAVRATLDGGTDFDWIGLAEACFDCTETAPTFIAAVLRKFVHQTKLKLASRTVGHHLMPVLTGVQGCGKTSFIESFVSPVSELSRDADFRMLADDRNIALWRSYVLVIDEMAYAERSDIEVVKHVITARALDRRPMRTNDVVTIKQRATLIGASNKSLSELVRDETGLRRFVSLPYRSDADWSYLNAVDWLAAWRSVSIDDPDPMDAFRTELAAQQAVSRHVSPVEAWLSDLTPTTCTTASSQTEQINAVDLYRDYLSHFHARNDGQRPKTSHSVMQEVGRLVKAHPDAYAIEKKKTKSGNVWCWRRPIAPVHPQLAVLLKEVAR